LIAEKYRDQEIPGSSTADCWDQDGR